MRRAQRFFVGVVLCAAAWAPLAGAQQSADPRAGDEFLKLVDAKKYAESWDASSGLLRQSVSRADWAAQMARARDTIGDVASRKLREAKPEHDPAGAPAGDYLLMTYDTVFASQGAPKVETLPLVKAPDGQWRAVGYFVRESSR